MFSLFILRVILSPVPYDPVPGCAPILCLCFPSLALFIDLVNAVSFYNKSSHSFASRILVLYFIPESPILFHISAQLHHSLRISIICLKEMRMNAPSFSYIVTEQEVRI